jgi:hypothetical protein
MAKYTWLLAAMLLGGMSCLSSGVAAAQPTPPALTLNATEWGHIRVTEHSVILGVDRPPAGGTVRMPRLNNPVAAVYLEGDKDRTPLALTPHVAEWEIALPIGAAAKAPLAVIVEAVGSLRFASRPPVCRPSASGVVTLAAHDAGTHGQRLRYEPQPHKNTLGYWTDASDWCQWRLAAPPGRYEVQILQGCGKGQGGSEVALGIGQHEIVFTVEETGHFQNFKQRTLGVVELGGDGGQAKEYTLTLRPKNKKAAAVMDVRQVRLVPVAKE